MVATQQAGEQQTEELTVPEALRLLGDVRFGRVVFTNRAMPAVRPVRHVLVGGQIVIAAGPELVLGTALAAAPGTSAETIVAYEADQLDPTGSSGWSVVVVGRARPVTDPAEADRYRRLLPRVGVPARLVAISADMVSGFRLAGPRDQRVAAGA